MNKSFKKFLIENQKLFETPLPDDWDKSTYRESNSFAKRLKYAQERAQKIGTGSSRVAFVIPYNGRETVLKIAKNEKGMAQNEFEAQRLEDWYIQKIGLFIPLIDYDEENNRPTWIHTEKAEKCRAADFKKACGGTPGDLVAYAQKVIGQRVGWGGNADKIDGELEFVQNFVDYAGNYGDPIGDLGRLVNWGMFNGSPVILDVGLSHDVFDKYYKLR